MSDKKNAAKLYQSFREAKPSRVRSIRIEIPKAVAVMGTVEFIGYVTTHGGKTHLYIHEFAGGSRPYFCAGGKGRKIFIVGGRYRVTERGIVDYGPTGKETHAKRRYKVELTE
jgi:hypothetical protein